MRTSPPAALTAVLVTGLVLGLAACQHDGRDMRAPEPDQTASIITTTTTVPGQFDTFPLDDGIGDTVNPADTEVAGDDQGRPDPDDLAVEGFTVALPWPEGGAIDRQFTCDGQDISPAMSWTDPPEGTLELAIVVVDPDADDYVHWIVAGIPPDVTTVSQDDPIFQDPGLVIGVNSGGQPGWSGPCPPSGETHTYRFEVHALSQQTEMPTGTPAEDLLRVVDFATLYAAVGTGTYSGQ